VTAAPRRLALAALAAGWLAAPERAQAHAFGQRYDLPLPLGFYLAAAGIAVAASFVASFVFLRGEPKGRLAVELPLPAWLGSVAAAVLRAVGLAVLAAVLLAAFVGPPAPTENLATVTVWVLWWVGFVLLSALLVESWPALDPCRGLFLLSCRLTGAPPDRARLALPQGAGWLAVAGLFALSWIELVSGWSEDPRALGILVLVYLATSLAAASLFGRRWFALADPLGRLFALLGRLAPVALRLPDSLHVSLPGERLCAPVEREAGAVALVVTLIGVVLFDGISETPFWQTVLEFFSTSQSLRGSLLAMKAAGVDLLQAIRTAGLLATVVLAYLAYWLLAWAMAAAAGRRAGARALALACASSLLPIAVAYHLSHYLSYLLLAGQLIVPIAADPFGQGWRLFALGPDPAVDLGIVTARQVWWVAVAVLVAGHGLSVVVAHRQAIALLGDRRLAVRSQLPMMAFMVGLTMLSLWILAQPIVE